MKRLLRALCAVCLSCMFCLRASGAAFALFVPSALALSPMAVLSVLPEERAALSESSGKSIRSDLARASGSLGALLVVSGAELLVQKRKR